MSSSARFVRSSSLRIAGAGPMPMRLGSTPTAAQETSRAIGASPWVITPSSEAMTSAAPPSTMPLALPAVTVPSFEKAAGSLARASSVVSGRR